MRNVYVTWSRSSVLCFFVTFRRYSVMKLTRRTHHYVHKTRDDVFSFISVDTCPDPAPRRPFNFFGVLTQVQHAHAHTRKGVVLAFSDVTFQGDN